MKWYVLQVLTGRELAVQEALSAKEIESLVPVENRVIRHGGKWMQREYILFSGYVFIHVSLDSAAYYKLRGIAGVQKMLCTSHVPSPLPQHEVDWLLYLGATLLEPSTIEFMGGGVYRIVDGALKSMVNQIRHIDRHKRRVQVEVQLLGKPHLLELSYKVHQGCKFML